MALLKPQATITAEWHSLITEAQQKCSLVLGEELESYLVFLLQRFTTSAELAAKVMALEFLHSIETSGQQRLLALQNVGDECLLFAGLFPGQAEHRLVKISYFVQLGQTAYLTLAEQLRQSFAQLYTHLCQHFVALMDVMHVMRELANGQDSLTLLQAAELWSDTHSQHALATLQKYSQATPLFFINKQGEYKN